MSREEWDSAVSLSFCTYSVQEGLYWRESRSVWLEEKILGGDP